MLSILGPKITLCDGITRRELLRVGGLAFVLDDRQPVRELRPT